MPCLCYSFLWWELSHPFVILGVYETLSPQSCLWRNAEGLTDASFRITKIMRRRAVDWDVRDTELWCSCPASLACALFPTPGQLINVIWRLVSFQVTEKTWTPPRLLPLEISNMQQIKDWEAHGFLTGRLFFPQSNDDFLKMLFSP